MIKKIFLGITVRWAVVGSAVAHHWRMAKIKNPITFSQCFGVAEGTLDKAGVLNPTLNVDTRLFIDPMLIPQSKHAEMRKARKTYERHFGQIIKLLAASKRKDDVAWRNARRLLTFPEIKWTCLGFGASSVSGSGSGAFTTNGVIETAKEVVDLGIDDPDLFVALGVFEEGIGPDRISDMTANVILPDLLAFNERVLAKLGVPTKRVQIDLRNGSSFSAELPINPFERGEQPVILVPSDILRDLPIAKDWSDVSSAAAKNSALRNQLNRDLGNIWKRRTIRDKAQMRDTVLASRQNFETFLDLIHGAKAKPYDLAGDPLGEIIWRRIAETIAAQQPATIKAPKQFDLAGVRSVVDQIIEQFRFLIEERRLSEELYHEGEPRIEKAAQRLFFAVAYAYCKANDLDLTPEADTGNGPVDFKVSQGFEGRVLVEIKLSTNSKVIAGYSRQLATYKQAEETVEGVYVVIDVGRMGRKDDQLLKLKNSEAKAGNKVSPIIIIDGKRRPSASKL